MKTVKYLLIFLATLLLSWVAFSHGETNIVKSSISLKQATGIAAITAPASSLAELACQIRPGFLLGSFADGLDSVPGDAVVLKEFFRRNFNIMTVGVYMGRTQRQPAGYDFERADALVKFAWENHEKIYFHPLIGGSLYTAKWVNEGNFSAEELRRIMRDRITTILTRYRGKVAYVDVVNEAIAGTGIKPDGQFKWEERTIHGDHVWMKTMGMYQGKKFSFPQYLVEAFRIAREVGGPDLKLVLNDWGNAATNSYRGLAFLKLVKALREEGVPLDGAGLQMHFQLKNGELFEGGGKAPFDFNAFDVMLRQYEKQQVDVHITEFDIYLTANPTPLDYQLQGKYYLEVLRHALASKAVKSFKTWGFTDKYSWKRNGPNGYPLLLDTNFQAKPAYLMSLELLKTLSRSR